MTRETPDRIIAHVDLLRAVDQMLVQAQTVREKRDTLERLLPSPTRNRGRQTTSNAEGRRRG